MRSGKFWLVAGLCAAASGPALASGLPRADDTFVRGAVTFFVPDESTHGVHGPLEGSFRSVGVSSETQFGLTYGYMLTNRIDVELFLSTPFKHKLTAHGRGADGATIGYVTQIPPTLSVDYHLRTGTRLSPYVGVGMNYTFFYNDHPSRSARRAGLQGLNVSNSFGPAVQVGADYALGDHLMLNASIRYIDMGVNAHVRTADGTTKVNVGLDPWVYSFGVGYYF